MTLVAATRLVPGRVLVLVLDMKLKHVKKTIMIARVIPSVLVITSGAATASQTEVRDIQLKFFFVILTKHFMSRCNLFNPC